MKKKLLDKFIDLLLLSAVVAMAMMAYNWYVKIQDHHAMDQAIIRVLEKQKEIADRMKEKKSKENSDNGS